MAWITPKTTWQPTDYINADDYNRIQGNLAHLADIFGVLVQAYESQSITDLPYADKWNIAEDNLDEINRLTYEFEIGAKKHFLYNTNYIDYEELNRLERAIDKIYNVYVVNLSLARHLAFRLGNTRMFDCPRGQSINANADVMGNRLDFELGEERGEYYDD